MEVMTLRSLIYKVQSLLYQAKVVSSLLYQIKLAFTVNSSYDMTL